MRFLSAAALAVLAMFKTSSAIQLKQGDVYEWSSWNLTTYTETPLQLTVLDSISATGSFVDSGSIWRLLFQVGSRPVDTLKLFAFKDGDLRWSRGSSLFPVELQSPHTVSVWKRGNNGWGDAACQGCLLVTEVLHTTDGAELKGQNLSSTTVTGGANPYVITIHRVHGAWTDTAGPIWFHTEGTNDFFLKSKNGRAISWQSPHLDTLRHRADSLDRSIRRRRAMIRYPQLGDLYLWNEKTSRTLLPPSITDPSRNSTLLTTAIVSEAPADSSGWIRRVFKIVTDSSVHIFAGTSTPEKSYTTRSDTLIIHQRWDSSGNVRSDVSSILSDLWCARAGDVESPDGSFQRGTGTYLPTGELLKQSWSYWRDFTGICRTCSDSRTYAATLLAAPGYATSTIGNPNLQTAKNNKIALQELALKDPLASVHWWTLDGRNGKQTASELARSQRRGVMRVRIQTSHGEVLEGTLVGW